MADVEPSASWIKHRPAPALARHVDHYIGYRLAGFEPGLHRGLPSPNMTLIASIGPSIDIVRHVDPTQSAASYGCVVGGLHARPALISHGGYQEGVAISLTPLGCRAVLGMPPKALVSVSAELADVAGPAGRELWHRLQGTTSWQERFAACDEVLGRLAEPDATTPPDLVHAWQVLLESGGSAPIREIADRLGWSRQYFARRFDGEFGLAPKLAARVIRFARVRLMLESTPPFVTLAQVAAACGYYDQAHLDRDFAEFAGCSPTAWLAAEQVPFVQDDAETHA